MDNMDRAILGALDKQREIEARACMRSNPSSSNAVIRGMTMYSDGGQVMGEYASMARSVNKGIGK